MDELVELARISDDGYVLEFRPGFRRLGWGATALGLALWGYVFWAWSAAGSWREMEISQFLVVAIFTLPFGVGLLVWSRQRIAVVQDRIASHHLGRIRQLERSTARVHRVIRGGTYLVDARGEKLFVSNWMVGYDRLMAEVKKL